MWHDQASFLFGVVDRSDTLVGPAALEYVNWMPTRLSCEIGFEIDRDHLRLGYATDAARLALGAAFNDLTMHRVQAGAFRQHTVDRATGEAWIQVRRSRARLASRGLLLDGSPHLRHDRSGLAPLENLVIRGRRPSVYAVVTPRGRWVTRIRWWGCASPLNCSIERVTQTVRAKRLEAVGGLLQKKRVQIHRALSSSGGNAP
jgi:hypothetical protein